MELQFNSKIYVAGHLGMVGSAIVRALAAIGFNNIVSATREELDLLDQTRVAEFISAERPDYIFIAAAKVGGIYSNSTFGADFLYQNLTVQNNIIHSAYLIGLEKLCFLGSSCIYPRDCKQPIREEYLLGGPLEKTNEPYAIAKIAGIKMCEYYNSQYGCKYLTVMPTNLYGPNDNYDPLGSHVLPALISKAHEAKETGAVELFVWGSGMPRREFLHVDDLAEACVFLMQRGIFGGPFNIGTGVDVTIKELAELVADVVGYTGNIVFDSSKPDGTPRKLLDSSRINKLGWKPRVNLRTGIQRTYVDFLETHIKNLPDKGSK